MGDNSPEQVDLVVIGAGIYGIQAARTYLELHPEKNVVILEASNAVGGVWSRERVYSDFWTQTPLGILEFSNQPMHPIPDSDTYYGFFKAKHVTTYLESYCHQQIFSGSSIHSRIRFSNPVVSLTKPHNLWTVLTNNNTIQCPHIIDASGLTSRPNYPHLPSLSTFRGKVLHHKDFAQFEQSTLKTPDKKKLHIAVLGGAKSAADIAYACAKAHHHVTWIIRRSGSGPAAFVSAKGSMGYRNSNESFYTRLVALFLVSYFALQMGYGFILRVLNQTRLGRALQRRIWKNINEKAWREADYDRADGKENGFENLKPDMEIFWQNDSTGINQREDFFDVVAKNVKVIREDISHMEENGIQLEKSFVKADVLICATGWEDSPPPYLSPELASTLGLAAPSFEAEKSEWSSLLLSADEKILTHFPLLRFPNPPSLAAPQFHLFNSLLPLSDQTILFPGRLMLGNHFRNAEVQALYCVAVLSGHLTLPPQEEMKIRVAETTAWCRRRYLKKGEKGNWFYWDMVPYTDFLLQEMGLEGHRKKGRGWGDLVGTCWASELRGLVGELRGQMKMKGDVV